MSTHALKIAGFALLCIFQWAMPVSWILQEENTRTKGIFVKIPCRQFDPADPFRGTFLNIQPLPVEFNFEDSSRFEKQQQIWVNYIPDSGEIYRFHSVQPLSEVPAQPIHLKAYIRYTYAVQQGALYTAVLDYPFSKYFINEKEAPRLAEKYNEALADTTKTVYAGLYILDGNAALDGLWIGAEKLE